MDLEKDDTATGSVVSLSKKPPVKGISNYFFSRHTKYEWRIVFRSVSLSVIALVQPAVLVKVVFGKVDVKF